MNKPMRSSQKENGVLNKLWRWTIYWYAAREYMCSTASGNAAETVKNMNEAGNIPNIMPFLNSLYLIKTPVKNAKNKM